MKKILLLSLLAVTSCASFQEDHANVLPESLKEVLMKCAAGMSMGVGYDSTYNTDFVYYVNKKDSSGGSMSSVLNEQTQENVISLYVEAYRINESVKYLHAHLKRLKKWKEYYYFNNEIIEPSEKFYSTIESYVKSKYSANYNSIEKMKQEKKIRGILFYQEQENIVDEY